MNKNLIDVQGLVKGYQSGDGHLPVLKGVDLAVAEGEMVGVLGASGIGKSTLLHVLGLLDLPEQGTVLFDGEDVFSFTEHRRTNLRNKSIGFLFQFHHLLPEFTALENVMMPLLIGRVPSSDAADRARQLLEVLGLGERGHHRPSQLSGGEQQRVAVARALVARPRLLLADEPTGNLDNWNSGELANLLRQCHREERLTSILVTHSEKIASICDRVLCLEDGYLKC